MCTVDALCFETTPPLRLCKSAAGARTCRARSRWSSRKFQLRCFTHARSGCSNSARTHHTASSRSSRIKIMALRRSAEYDCSGRYSSALLCRRSHISTNNPHSVYGLLQSSPLAASRSCSRFVRNPYGSDVRAFSNDLLSSLSLRVFLESVIGISNEIPLTSARENQARNFGGPETARRATKPASTRFRNTFQANSRPMPTSLATSSTDAVHRRRTAA